MISTGTGIFIFAMMILVVVLAIIGQRQMEKCGYCKRPEGEDGEKKV